MLRLDQKKLFYPIKDFRNKINIKISNLYKFMYRYFHNVPIFKLIYFLFFYILT